MATVEQTQSEMLEEYRDAIHELARLVSELRIDFRISKNQADFYREKSEYLELEKNDIRKTLSEEVEYWKREVSPLRQECARLRGELAKLNYQEEAEE